MPSSTLFAWGSNSHVRKPGSSPEHPCPNEPKLKVIKLCSLLVTYVRRPKASSSREKGRRKESENVRSGGNKWWQQIQARAVAAVVAAVVAAADADADAVVVLVVAVGFSSKSKF